MTRQEAVGPKLVAEFVGTFMLCFTVGSCINAGIYGEAFKAFAATAIACVLTVSIYALGPISGGHFNPAVSLACGLAGKMELERVGLYVLVQMFAGLLAGPCSWGMYGKIVLLQPGQSFGWVSAMFAEMLYTLMLCYVVLNVACSKNTEGNQFYGLAIGFVIVAAGYAAGSISGAVLNPAVALAIANPFASVSDSTSTAWHNVQWLFSYWGWQLMGSALATMLYLVTRDRRFTRGGAGGLPRTPGVFDLSQKVIAEFVGTFFLVLTVGLNVLGLSRGTVWSIAASLMCMIYALGDISGGHFNPAVTVAVLASGRGKITPMAAGCYVGAQFVGGIIASLVYAGMNDWRTFTLAPGDDYGWFSAMIGEFMFTFLLAFVVLSVATVEKPLDTFFGFAIASVVTAGGYAIGAVSGGALNPAVAMGISTADLINNYSFHHGLIYSIAEIAGGGAAAGAFMVMRPGEFSKGAAPVLG